MAFDKTTHQTEAQQLSHTSLIASMATHDISLHVRGGPHAGLSLSFDREHLLIGRGDWCDLALPEDRQISKQHCELELTPDGILVKDLGSRNGIMLGHIRVFEACWPHNVQLQLGESTLALEFHQQPREIKVHFADQSALLVGRSAPMRKLFSLIPRLGAQDLPILLLGETGTGKTTVARSIHAQSQRASHPFVEVNCGTLSVSLIESMLFGHEKGAFTGAERLHRGYFEQAHKGTLLLDEIGELPLALQPKLLSVLERGRIQRLGSEAERDVDFRLICSTHKDLAKEVAEGRFRQDLYYRLAVIELRLPPLRERKEDIPLLVHWLLHNATPPSPLVFSAAAIDSLQQCLWPGNVRELSNAIWRTIALLPPLENNAERLYIEASDLMSLDERGPLKESTSARPPGDKAFVCEGVLDLDAFDSLKALMEDTEKRAILHALQASAWIVPEAAKRLQITRPWLYKRIKKFDLSLP